MTIQIIRNIFLTALLSCFLLAAPQAAAGNTAIGPIDENSLLRNNLQNIVTHLENYGERSSWEKQNQAAAWAKHQLETLGLDTWVETYEYKGRQWPNVFAQIRGKTRPKEIILVLAHIDSISDSGKSKAPGADDNATGVAVLMETARFLKKSTPDRSIRFCIFSNEERGALGSKANARKARVEHQDIRAVINMDILGYNPQKTSVTWKMFLSDASLKYKTKALIKITTNSIVGITNSPSSIIVAGRPKYAGLVEKTARGLRTIDGLAVKERVQKDCG